MSESEIYERKNLVENLGEHENTPTPQIPGKWPNNARDRWHNDPCEDATAKAGHK
jgi:hypothetical protein